MKLVIAEKPSVAQALSKIIGATKRRDGYLEGSGYLISWCVGHLVELSAPERYDERFAKWRLEDLPILPERWLYEISQTTRKQYQVLKSLMERSDVMSLVCATDAGREGELIFRLVYNQARCKKPFERLWISSMEDAAIREGFEKLEPGAQYDLLYEAALCRERADWIVGMNATRLFSCMYGQTLAVGRVMTPTLAMVVMRDAQIEAFKPEPFWTVQISAGGITATSRRFRERSDAEALLLHCKAEGEVMVETIETKEKTEHPPILYNLTALQRDANRILGFTAQQTLDYCQSLYEKKLITYPRTDSRYLTYDMQHSVPNLAYAAAKHYGVQEGKLRADPVRKSAVFDSSKVTDHYAIIPTKSISDGDDTTLSGAEKAILQLITARLLCAMQEDYRYTETSMKMSCCGEDFTWKVKNVLQHGWKRIWNSFYPEKKSDEEQIDLVLSEDTMLDLDSAELYEGRTSPPKHFTEDMLLSAMETAGAEDMPEDAERKGLGTPATRAGIIEKMIQRGYIERKGEKKTKYLMATDKGNALIAVMPEQIKSPSMTAEWEQKLLQIEHGEYDPEDFMDDIKGMIANLVMTSNQEKGAETLMKRNKVIGTCPHCGAEVLEKQKGWFCSNHECRFILWKDNAYFAKIGKRITPEIVEKLLTDKEVSMKGCKNQKTGKTYDADLLLSTEADGRPQFAMKFPDRKEGGGKWQK